MGEKANKCAIGSSWQKTQFAKSDWTEVTDKLVIVEDKARCMIAEADGGTQEEINVAWQQLKDASDVLKQQAIDSMNTIAKEV
ncbi:hypothetical protein MH117_02945 [Paenibacillus sp. ACRRX]|uniref:hypothetical protein n=1 Tax=Paenibacillus sp. ACRRX TaxID=2918206 RepID=UPI001EF56141|nr:hypothetical protein [Paenibacillus sp. ACRRX]MCG7406359.1 hypothetical protein [Paenibacillus sp. ACRRX]